MLFYIINFIVVIIGCIIGNLLFSYLMSKSIKNSIFKKSDFIDFDNDFFSDSSDSSITDIPNNSERDTSNENAPKFF